MVKLVGPLLSLQAHGTLGRALTFSTRREGAQVRYQRKQTDYENTARETVREAYHLGIELWNSMPQNEKDYWKEVERKGYANV